MTRATLRYDQSSPTKVRQVLDLVRGLDVAEAREILRFSQRGASEEVAKLLDSAIANAEHNDHIASDELFVSAAWAERGPDREAVPPACPWPGHPDPQAHEPHHHRGQPLLRRRAARPLRAREPRRAPVRPPSVAVA